MHFFRGTTALVGGRSSLLGHFGESFFFNKKRPDRGVWGSGRVLPQHIPKPPAREQVSNAQGPEFADHFVILVLQMYTDLAILKMQMNVQEFQV
jgi:hypothetical protein